MNSEISITQAKDDLVRGVGKNLRKIATGQMGIVRLALSFSIIAILSAGFVQGATPSPPKDSKNMSQETKKTPEKAGEKKTASVSTNGVPQQAKAEGKPADAKPADAKPGDKPVSEDDEAIPENLVKASRRIRGFLDTLGIKYKYKPENEDIRFTIRVDGKIGSFDVIILCCKSSIDCRFLHPLRVEEARRDEMAKLLVRLNHELDECWYDMDFADGEIVVRSMLAPEVVLKGDTERFLQFLQTSIETMQEELNMVLKVALGYKTAEEAVKED